MTMTWSGSSRMSTGAGSLTANAEAGATYLICAEADSRGWKPFLLQLEADVPESALNDRAVYFTCALMHKLDTGNVRQYLEEFEAIVAVRHVEEGQTLLGWAENYARSEPGRPIHQETIQMLRSKLAERGY